jgi:enoyl-CoA hydratase/carnithine racemase
MTTTKTIGAMRYIRYDIEDRCGLITLDRPEVLNAWHKPMRDELLAALEACEHDPAIRAIVLTGAGERAFCAGQDLNEAHDFDADRAVAWIGEWERLYGLIRGLSKPLIMALNGLAAGSAFQVALLGDIRVGHAGTRMGQPEINAGIASITGPWIMREVLGLSRTVELTLSGRLMDGAECHRLGLLHHYVEQRQVLPTALRVAAELAEKSALAIALDKQWLRELTQPGFEQTFAAARRFHRQAFGSGESARRIERFFTTRGAAQEHDS